ncbi:MAG: alkaline phosphatase family protein, partial [Bryobacteraceae bacterium]
LEGPPNSLRKDHRYTTADLIVDVDPQKPVARLTAGDSFAIVRQGEWSGWLRVEFPLLRRVASAKGMFRVFVRQLHPSLELYVSPINLDPHSPELPISAPPGFSREIADEIGPYYTQGIAEDTSALRQGALDLREFLEQSHLVLQDERKLLRYSLRHFHDGLLFFYFSSIDQNSHVLWGKYEAELLPIYRAVDEAIGEVMEKEPDADLIVLSDHGFTTFDRAVNLNTWLWKQGFLSLRGAPGGDELFAHVDWSETQIYALGLNGLYLNLAGREKYGIVKRGVESEAILSKAAAQLLAFHDPENGRQVVESAYAMPAGPGVSRAAPDMIVGYGRGYRASWQTALGATPESVLDDNTDAWIADHCINAVDVPGVLFSNRKIRATDPGLKDVTVSVLALFGSKPGAAMTGRVLF